MGCVTCQVSPLSLLGPLDLTLGHFDLPLTYPPAEPTGRTIGEGHGASSLAPSLRPGDIVIIDNLPPCPGARLGIVAAQGREGLKELLKVIADERMPVFLLMPARA